MVFTKRWTYYSGLVWCGENRDPLTSRASSAAPWTSQPYLSPTKGTNPWTYYQYWYRIQVHISRIQIRPDKTIYSDPETCTNLKTLIRIQHVGKKKFGSKFCTKTPEFEIFIWRSSISMNLCKFIFLSFL